MFSGEKEFEVVKHGVETILKMNYLGKEHFPSIEDSPIVMRETIKKLLSNSSVTKVIFTHNKNYEYNFEQVSILKEIGNLYSSLSKQKELFSAGQISNSDPECTKLFFTRYAFLQNTIIKDLPADPIGTYVKLKRKLRDYKFETTYSNNKCIEVDSKYDKAIHFILLKMEGLQIIKGVKDKLSGHQVGTRKIYKQFFDANIKPNFIYTSLLKRIPLEAKELDSYALGSANITIFELDHEANNLYHVMPLEFTLNEDKYNILNLAKEVISEHKPESNDFIDPHRLREVFYNIAKDLIEEIAEFKGVKLSQKDVKDLSNILIRYTVGFGLIETLLEDENVQDISINSPANKTPIFITHSEFEDCKTNIIPEEDEVEGWASRLRMISGKPLDASNPILDTEIETPHARARVSTIGKPLNPYGYGFSFRRHRDKPWTLPLLIKKEMLTSEAAGLLSFIIDGARTMLIAGTRGSGKSSFLTAIIIEIMRKYRMITVEDTLELPTLQFADLGYNIQPMSVKSALSTSKEGFSAEMGIRSTLRLGDSCLIVGEVRSSLRGDEEVVIVDNKITKRIQIKDLENYNISQTQIPTLSNSNKIELHNLTGFVKHPKRKKLTKIITQTGREITVTPDHSVFTHVNFKIAAIESNKLKENDPIIIPSSMPSNFNNIKYLNLLEIFKDEYRLEGAEEYIRKVIKKIGWKKTSEICKIKDIYQYLLTTQKTRIPINSFLDLIKESNVKYNINKLKIKRGTSTPIPANFPINNETLRLIGYYLAEGNITRNQMQITNSKPKIIQDIKKICKNLGIEIQTRKIEGLGTSTQMKISSRALIDLFIYLGCGKTSFHKRIPPIIFGLSGKKISQVLKGMYSGDGSFSATKNSGNSLRYYSTAKKLVEDVNYALLTLGIVGRISSKEPSNKGNKIMYYIEFKKQEYVKKFLKEIGFTHKKPKMIIKSFSHSKHNIVNFEIEELEKHIKLPNKYRHLRQTKSCSKDYLKKIISEVKSTKEIEEFAKGEFFIDRIKEIKEINLKEKEYVYDLSVETTERFIGGFGGILLHNTEALALYEAMRVGALANVVAGTIHGDSPYGVYDRLVNDLGVPKTSFKATDIVIVANPIKTSDGLHRNRRITSITEVRKHWENDPQLEGGFMELFKYDPQNDRLELTDDLINGESDILKAIGSNVKQWAGNWDAIWENITLRGKVKKLQVDTSNIYKNDALLEAAPVILANDMFHKIAEKVNNEDGNLDPEKIYFKFKDWYEGYAKEYFSKEK